MRKINQFIFIAVIFLNICLNAFSAPEDFIQVREIKVFSEQEEFYKQFLMDLVEGAISQLTNQYYHEIVYLDLAIYPNQDNTNEYSIEITADLGEAEESIDYRGIFIENSKDYQKILFADKIKYLLALLQGDNPIGDSPFQLLEEVYTDNIIWGNDPEGTVQHWPLSVDSESGKIVFGMNSICLETDTLLRVNQEYGQDLREDGQLGFAATVGITPGFSIFTKSLNGSEFSKFISGSDNPINFRSTFTTNYPIFDVLPDGSGLLVVNQEKKAAIIAKEKTFPIELFTNQNSNYSRVRSDSEGYLWCWDGMEKRFKVYSNEGRLISSFVPILPQDGEFSNLYFTDLLPFESGKVIAVVYNGIFCFDLDGRLLWKMGADDGFTLHKSATLAYDKDSGLLYVTDSGNKRVTLLVNQNMINQSSVKTELEEILNLQKHIEAETGLIELIRYYQSIGAFELAKNSWDRIFENSDESLELNKEFEKLEVEVSKRTANRLSEKTQHLLSLYGPETARSSYQSAVRAFEKVLSVAPWEQEAEEDMEALKQKFLKNLLGENRAAKIIRITDSNVANIFPSLFSLYRNNSIGSIHVKNISDEIIKSLKTTIYIKNYMDFPFENIAEVSIAPGEDGEAFLNLLMNDQVFSLQEDLPVQVEISITAITESNEHSIRYYAPLTLYRRTSLTWDKTENLLPFITHNEKTVSDFAHYLLSSGAALDFPGASKAMSKAIVICDGLGAYDINYTKDPESPIRQEKGRNIVVDTVRFPRETLRIRAGDCDDTTSLLASLLEAVGIKTAVMTSPGHVFLAFDSEIPSENKWIYQSKQRYVKNYDGSLWIPIESTSLNDSFSTAWEIASRELLEYHDDQNESAIGFFPVYENRDSYPPLPLPETSFELTYPKKEELQEHFLLSINDLKETLLEQGIAVIQEKMFNVSGDRLAVLQNRMGALLVKFGEYEKANEIFSQSIIDYPELIQSYIFMANILNIEGEYNEALSVLRQGQKIKPDSAHLNLLLARTFYASENYQDAQKYYMRLKTLSEGLASRYSYLESSPDSNQRAGLADFDMEMIWEE